jgi:hypothetical protein
VPYCIPFAAFAGDREFIAWVGLSGRQRRKRGDGAQRRKDAETRRKAKGIFQRSETSDDGTVVSIHIQEGFLFFIAPPRLCAFARHFFPL